MQTVLRSWQPTRLQSWRVPRDDEIDACAVEFIPHQLDIELFFLFRYEHSDGFDFIPGTYRVHYFQAIRDLAEDAVFVIPLVVIYQAEEKLTVACVRIVRSRHPHRASQVD